MKNRMKVLFMVLGIVLGSLLTISATLLITGDSHESEELHSEEHDHEAHANAHTDEGESGGHAEHEDIVRLDEHVIAETGIKVKEAGPVKIKEKAHFTAKITAIPENIAHIIPRYEGVVKKVLVQPGDRVSRDEVVAVIESNESLMDYEVKSSIEGTVINVHLTPGEYAAGEEHVIEIAQLDQVWAEIAVYEKDLNKVKKGQKVTLKGLFAEEAYTGTIFYKSPLVNEETRSGLARVLVNNKNGSWMPGMFLTADVTTSESTVGLGVEVSALHNYEGGKVVFVLEKEGFKPQPVKTGVMDENYIQIISGLNKGDNYVSHGAFVVKSELMKESFGGGHNH